MIETRSGFEECGITSPFLGTSPIEFSLAGDRTPSKPLLSFEFVLGESVRGPRADQLCFGERRIEANQESISGDGGKFLNRHFDDSSGDLGGDPGRADGFEYPAELENFRGRRPLGDHDLDLESRGFRSEFSRSRLVESRLTLSGFHRTIRATEAQERRDENEHRQAHDRGRDSIR